MLYKVRVLLADKEIIPWDALECIEEFTCQTPELKPLPEKPSDAEMNAAKQNLRQILKVENGEDTISVWCDDLGSFYATAGTVFSTTTSTTQLSRRTWRQVGKRFLRVEPVFEPMTTWDDLVNSKLTRRQRFVRWFFRQRCGGCAFFDVRGASEWRKMVTHAFHAPAKGEGAGPMSMSMWDDITKISAEQYRAPDILPGEMGYCVKLDRGLAAMLPACAQYHRRESH